MLHKLLKKEKLFRFSTFYNFSEYWLSPQFETLTFTVNTDAYAITKGYVLVILMPGIHNNTGARLLYKVAENPGAWTQQQEK